MVFLLLIKKLIFRKIRKAIFSMIPFVIDNPFPLLNKFLTLFTSQSSGISPIHSLPLLLYQQPESSKILEQRFIDLEKSVNERIVKLFRED